MHDHYVSQTYLRHFNNEHGKLWVYDKQQGVRELYTSQVCWEKDGSTNPLFENNRIIEEYLNPIENNWATAIEVFSRKGVIKTGEYLKAKETIAAYMGFLRAIPPAKANIQESMLKSFMNFHLHMMQASGKLPPPPEGHEDILDKVKVVITDKNVPHAMRIESVSRSFKILFHAPWCRMYNFTEHPYLTSDNPTCFIKTSFFGGGTIYLPLTPKLAVAVKPIFPREIPDGYDHPQDVFGEVESFFAGYVNESIIKHAERWVVSDKMSEEIQTTVNKYKNSREEVHSNY